MSGNLPESLYPDLDKVSLDDHPGALGDHNPPPAFGIMDMPTVVEHHPFDPDADAEALYGAMRGLGTREKSIIDLLCARTNDQRQRIAMSYKNIHGKDVISALKGELKIIISGHFESVIIALFKVPEMYDAEQIHHAIHLPLSDEDMLITILCTRSNEELTILKGAYRMQYDHDMLAAIGEHVHTSAFFKTLLAAVLQATRDERPEETDLTQIMKNVEQAKWDARALYDAGPKRWGSEKVFIPIFTNRSLPQLRIIFEELEKLTDLEVEKVIANELHNDIGKFLESLVKYIKNKHKFFAEVLYKSMKGLGTHDRKLMHTIISRSEKDLGSIRDQFDKMYAPKTLTSFIVGDTSGYYKSILLALAGCKREHEHVAHRNSKEHSPKEIKNHGGVPSIRMSQHDDDY
ncbi:Annexin A11 [Hypsibius exemplaris]|uniref:Annexin A11 n=1 Tax=Hypsibius exemplaris TaxID=2072580 RepID=A0A1W0XE22_HYPEX|nr:Annexin A11 [Hypsibius exemplaris]